MNDFLRRRSNFFESPMSNRNPYDQDYFLFGKQSGKSNYENYSWKRDATVHCVMRMCKFMGIHTGHKVLDWGCARGYYVRALRYLGVNALGYDISAWAIENCDETVKEHVSTVLPGDFEPHYIICKDVLEHIPLDELRGTIRIMLRMAMEGILIIVPLAKPECDQIPGKREYVAPQDNADKTHVNCWTLETWIKFLQGHIDKAGSPFCVAGGYKLPGVKEACDDYPHSVGFLKIFRV